REREREQNQSSMPDNNQLDSPTTVVGEEEYFPNLEKELEHALDYIKILLAELEHRTSEYSDNQKNAKYEIDTLRSSLTNLEDLENKLAEKQDALIDLN